MMERSATILVVDEGADEQTQYVADLKDQGFEVHLVPSGDRGLDAIGRDRFDLVLLDVGVAPRGGFEVLRSIRAEYGVLSLPVIMVLSQDDSRDAVAALDAGANDYIARPIDRSLLQARIRARLIRFHAARDLERIKRSLEAEVQAKVQEAERSATFFNTVLDNIHDGVVACNANGSLSLFNKAARKMHGLQEHPSAPETLAKRCDLFRTDGVTPIEANDAPLVRALRGERVSNQNMIIAPGGGREVAVVASGQAMVDANGNTLGAVISMHDTTAQRCAEAALRESEERFRSAFETAPHGMALVAPDGRWLKVNRALCEIVGYPEEELLKRDFQTITHPDDLDSDLEQVQAVLEGRLSSYQMEKRYFRKDGEIVWVLLSVSLVRDGAGKPLYFVSQILDLTERRATDAQLLQAQKMQALGELTGGVAHDFNNLLSVIIGNAKLLERRLAGHPVSARQTAAICDAARRGADLTQRLLVFSRKGHLEPKTVDAKKLVCRLLDFLRPLLGEAVEIKAKIASGDFFIFVDPNQLEAAIVNLATNARDAMPSGGHLTIALDRVEADRAEGNLPAQLQPGNYLMLSVADTGVGIPLPELERIFEPFFTTKEIGKGTGLGLSMVFGFAQESRGQMDVESVLGEGTTFRLYLPLATDPAPACEEAEVLEAHDDLSSPKGESIMVVEDEPSLRRLVRTWLIDRGYRVVEAEDGPEALSKLEQNGEIDLLFTDVVMPGGMTGYELARCARERRPDLKVLFTSGYSPAEVRREPRDREDAPLVAKPYEEIELAKRVRQALDAV